jgi:hypothetical protein
MVAALRPASGDEQEPPRAGLVRRFRGRLPRKRWIFGAFVVLVLVAGLVGHSSRSGTAGPVQVGHRAVIDAGAVLGCFDVLPPGADVSGYGSSLKAAGRTVPVSQGWVWQLSARQMAIQLPQVPYPLSLYTVGPSGQVLGEAFAPPGSVSSRVLAGRLVVGVPASELPDGWPASLSLGAVCAG